MMFNNMANIQRCIHVFNHIGTAVLGTTELIHTLQAISKINGLPRRIKDPWNNIVIDFGDMNPHVPIQG